MISVWCLKHPYLDHLQPIWEAIPAERRDWVYVSDECWAYAESLGLRPRRFREYLRQPGPMLIFSRAEVRRMPAGVPIVFAEHGVGPNYGGKSHLDRLREQWANRMTALLTTPAQAPAHERLFPGRVHVVGCPKLDRWHGFHKGRSEPPTVAFSHHWEQRIYPETRSAWPWDAEAWERVIASGRYTMLGHKHPGDPRDIEGWCREHGVEFVSRFDEIMERADLFVADNTSTLYEFAATDRPVVVLSPPWYRRDVHHGVRFWEHIPGVECAVPEHLEACIEEALEDMPARRLIREQAVTAVYGPLDGRATERAVEILLEIDETLSGRRFPWAPSDERAVIYYRHIRTGRIRGAPPAPSRRRLRYERDPDWERI